MAKHSKRYRQAAAKIDRARRYPLDEAIQVLVTSEGVTKFDETVELAVKLGVDPRQADQNVRGTVVLPHGRGKAVRVVVFAKGEKAKEASEAAGDPVGGGEGAQKNQEEQWVECRTPPPPPRNNGGARRPGEERRPA